VGSVASQWETQRTSFGPAAGLYDRIRPRYPVEAVRWLLGPEPVRVVDLGAGTGILTRQLVELGHEVTAVEPDAGMRARLASALPGVPALDGAAEAVPLPDHSVDAVVAGQAYHWFDRDRAHAEVARVLRPGGIFGPVWNVRDESVPWVRELSVLMEECAERATTLDERELGPDAFGPLFGPATRATFAFSVVHTADSLVDLMRSRSYYLAAPPDRRDAIDRAVRALVSTRTEFELPYVTYAYRARRSQ
jgi:SAM-dependent methyltransferase